MLQRPAELSVTDRERAVGFAGYEVVPKWVLGFPDEFGLIYFWYPVMKWALEVLSFWTEWISSDLFLWRPGHDFFDEFWNLSEKSTIVYRSFPPVKTAISNFKACWKYQKFISLNTKRQARFWRLAFISVSFWAFDYRVTTEFRFALSQLYFLLLLIIIIIVLLLFILVHLQCHKHRMY